MTTVEGDAASGEAGGGTAAQVGGTAARSGGTAAQTGGTEAFQGAAGTESSSTSTASSKALAQRANSLLAVEGLKAEGASREEVPVKREAAVEEEPTSLDESC